jgi:hypothetical protein
MKLKIIGAALLIIALSSCSKDFLEIQPETTLTTPVFFKTQADFEQAINGAYAPLRALYNNAWAMGEIRSDNTTYRLNPNNRGTLDAEQIADFINTSNNGTVTAKYTNDYLIIARANQVLARIDAAEFDQTVKDNIKGQALFLRSLSYFDLVQYFGPVPLHLIPVETREQTSLPLTSTDSIYAQVIADAQQAASLLPLKSAQEEGRATSGTAKTLLGNVYVVLKQYANAEGVLKDVVTSGEYSLLPDYAAVFNPAVKNNRESVFEVQYKEGSEGYASNFVYQFIPQPISAEELTAAFANYGVTPSSLQAATGEGYNIPTPDVIAAYEAGDKRKDASIGYATISGTAYPFIIKYLHPHAQANITNDNWPVYRYAEVLLLLAEALNEQGKSSEALPYLNMVRSRAGLGDITATSQGELRGIILHERRVELAFENKRWLDLVRTGEVEEVMSAFGTRVKANPQAYYFPAGLAPAPAAYTDLSLTFPLPASEALLSPYF